MEFFFDLQRFGGKGGSTATQTYEPTEHELELQKLEVEYTKYIMPSAKDLNNYAGNLLRNSGGTIPVNYAELFVDADAKIAAGLEGVRTKSWTKQPIPTFADNLSDLKIREIFLSITHYTNANNNQEQK